MKDDKLHKAINELPEFQAPEIWSDIEKKLEQRNRRIIMIITVLIFISGAVFFGGKYLVKNEKQYTARTETKSYLIPQTKKQGPVYYEPKTIKEVNTSDTYYNSENNTENNITDAHNNVKTSSINDNNNKTESTSIKEPETKEIISYATTGENLVNNPSFEEYRVCPRSWIVKPIKRLIPFWDVPSEGTPDYFNGCSREEAGVPDNFAGKMFARSDNGYAGLILRQNFTRDNRITGEKPLLYREYIQTELKQELEAEKNYRIKFWICNSSNSRFAVDAIGACITTDKISEDHNAVINRVPAIENPAGEFLANQNYWHAIEGIYNARGGEKFLTIGNFKNNHATRYIMQSASEFNYAYYYIDDVSVQEVKEIREIVLISNTQKNNIAQNENRKIPEGDF
jgi:hypothetical protein